MKLRKLLLFTMAVPAVALLLAETTYKLVIRTNSGEEITLQTKDIQKMEFVEKSDQPVKLATPVPTATRNADNSYTVSWNAVAGADSYSWTCGGSSSFTSKTSYTFTSLAVGEYVFRVRAIPADEKEYLESDQGEVKFTVKEVHDPGQNMQMVIDNFTHNYARVMFLPNKEGQVTGAVIPASAGTTDAELVAYIASLSSDKKKTFDGTKEFTFNGLEPSTRYLAAIVDSENVIATREFTTEAVPVPGTTGTVYPVGVSHDSGFVDVDKVGDTLWGSDSPLCWACVSAAMCQWWIDDYKASTGEDYALKHPIHEESPYYITPIMDLFSQAFVHQAGEPGVALSWFFVGEEHPERVWMNGIKCYNEDYEYVKGGWMNMSQSEFKKYYSVWDRLDLYKGLDQAGVKAKFADVMLGWLRSGPVYFNITKGNHALCAYGAEYKVEADGSKVITKLFIIENDLRPGNAQNAIQDVPVQYSDFTNGTCNYPWIKLSTISDGGTIGTGDIGRIAVLRSWRSVHGEKK